MIEAYGLSDVGCVRELNEDSFCIYGFDEEKDVGFCVLADGMGGHNAGEVASQSAVKFIAEELNKLLVLKAYTNIPQKLREALEKANDKVYKMSCEDSNRSGMGTTVVAAFICRGKVYIANVGDSRAYAVYDDEIFRITTDHSVVEELIKAGSITEEEARNHPQKNVITRALGTDAGILTDIFECEFKAGDTLLICSDGLTTMVEDKRICEIINEEKNVEDAAKRLSVAAKASGGIDNITVICARFI